MYGKWRSVRPRPHNPTKSFLIALALLVLIGGNPSLFVAQCPHATHLVKHLVQTLRMLWETLVKNEIPDPFFAASFPPYEKSASPILQQMIVRGAFVSTEKRLRKICRPGPSSVTIILGLQM